MNQPDISKSTEIVCDECNSSTFVERLLLRRMSRFLTGTDKDQVIPLPVMVCGSCGHINDEFMPKFPKPDSE